MVVAAPVAVFQAMQARLLFLPLFGYCTMLNKVPLQAVYEYKGSK
jgi:hypothetical protein